MRSSWSSVAVAGSVGAFIITGCKPRQAALTAPPPPEVSTAHPIVKTFPTTLDFTGTTEGIDQVQVRARVRGYIQSRKVNGGERVKEGDVLFMIDPRPFQATVDQAKADVAQNQAKLKLAEIKLERTQQSGNAVSKNEVDQAIADRDAAAAMADLAKAKLTSAELDLEYTNVRAPIGGRLSVDVPSVGALVGESTTQVLCTIINDQTIYVTFNVPEEIVLTMRKQYDYSRPGEGGRPPLPVFAGFANDGDTFPFAGQYESSDPGFDPNTGTARVRAIFKNPDGAISAGAFARIRSVTGAQPFTFVPDAAINSDQGGRFLYTVNDKGIVERLPVEVGGVIDRMRKITSPLPPATQVIVNGLQRARPNIPVKATLITLPEPKMVLGVGEEASTRPSNHSTTAPATQPMSALTNDTTNEMTSGVTTAPAASTGDAATSAPPPPTAIATPTNAPVENDSEKEKLRMRTGGSSVLNTEPK